MQEFESTPIANHDLLLLQAINHFMDYNGLNVVNNCDNVSMYMYVALVWGLTEHVSLSLVKLPYQSQI